MSHDEFVIQPLVQDLSVYLGPYAFVLYGSPTDALEGRRQPEGDPLQSTLPPSIRAPKNFPRVQMSMSTSLAIGHPGLHAYTQQELTENLRPWAAFQGGKGLSYHRTAITSPPTYLDCFIDPAHPRRRFRI